jgi:DNA-binding CsgD family transcriptional regulator
MGVEHLIEQFADSADRCVSLAELAVLAGDGAREIGFDYFAMTFCDNLRQSAPRFEHLDNYPAAYAELFVARRLYQLDPILHAAQRRIGGFPWDIAGEIVPVARSQSDFRERAAREGLRDGYTVPANVPGEPCGAVSFATRQAMELTPVKRSCADCLGRIAFEASRRLRGLSCLSAPVPHLNAREVQCLRRLRMGEIDKEIARALGISPETVRQYIKMSRTSYHARTRAQLIALALRDAQILFEETIPPIG